MKALLNRRSIFYDELESAINLLSFSTKVVISGKAFLRRLYSVLSKK